VRLRAVVLSSLVAGAGLGACQAFAVHASGPSPGDRVPESVIDLLIQKVCVDPGGKVLPVDPFACGDPNRLRRLRVGEAQPYHNHDVSLPGHPEGMQRKDSYPVLDLRGRLLVVNPFNYEPFDRFKASGDGYDIYRATGGWVSGAETRDGGGFSTTFFGAGCRPWGGWVFFPTIDPVVAGSADLPIEGRYWQQNGEAWPGQCNPLHLRPSSTSWEWLPNFAFGGLNGLPVKKLDALRSIHGSPGRPEFLESGHLEVFYFTRLYGLTRWETWRPWQQIEQRGDRQRQVQHARKVCGGPYEMTYQGAELIMSACRDWSAVTVAATPEPPPPWPIPDLNLLHNFSFADGTSGWTVSGQGGTVPRDGALRLANSRLPRDTRYVQPGGSGLRYVVIDCLENCPSLSQTVTLPHSPTVSHLVFAGTIRSEEVPGTVRLTLTQLDAAGKELGESDVTAQVAPGKSRLTGSESVLLSSTFVIGPRPVAVDPRARAVRFAVSPISPGRFDITDAWLMPSPID
jgi:hypothetical protein